MAATAVQGASTAADRYAHTERIGFGVFMILGPLLLLAATIIHPKHGIRVTSGSEYYDAAYGPGSTLRTRCSSSQGSP